MGVHMIAYVELKAAQALKKDRENTAHLPA